MNTEIDIENLVHLIEISDLDPTIKGILVRDLKAEGLTDFLREQIKVYCIEGLKKIDEQVTEAKKVLEQTDISSTQNPAQ